MGSQRIPVDASTIRMVLHRMFLGIVIALVGALGIRAETGLGQDFRAPDPAELQPMLRIDWRLGPDYPMGIQESALGCLDGKIVSAGGFTRHPLDVCKQFPEAFGGQPSGFTSLSLLFDPQRASTGWTRIADMPGPARQGPAVAVVDDAMYVMGGLNYTEPLTYRDTYRLQKREGQWNWELLASAQLPWPVYGDSGSTAVIGKKIYLLGAADSFLAPGTQGADFHSEQGRTGVPIGNALLVLDTANPAAGWTRLKDCPGVPKFDSALAAVQGKLYQLGGNFAPLNPKNIAYYNAVDSWTYNTDADQWTRLHDMPPGANRRAIACADRYILLIGGYKYPETRHVDGTTSNVYSAEEKKRAWGDFFEKNVLVYDTRTGRLGTADPMLEQTSLPSATMVGDTIYALGGEGGPRVFHPATLQIGRISPLP